MIFICSQKNTYGQNNIFFIISSRGLSIGHFSYQNRILYGICYWKQITLYRFTALLFLSS